jgi:hypothetical protein
VGCLVFNVFGDNPVPQKRLTKVQLIPGSDAIELPDKSVREYLVSTLHHTYDKAVCWIISPAVGYGTVGGSDPVE